MSHIPNHPISRLYRIWFLLVSSDGQPLKGTSADKVSFPSSDSTPDIADFRVAVKDKYANLLSFVDAPQLKVYENKIDFDGEKDPLKPSQTVDGYGKTVEDALLVLVPPNAQLPTTVQKYADYLKFGYIDKPKTQVLATISKRYSQQLRAVLDIGLPGPCVDLYETVKELPSTITRGVIQKEMNISINGPMSLAQPNILIAIDLDAEKHLFVKLLRMPQTTTSQPTAAKKDAVTAEINTCTTLSKENILGLVKCDVVEVTVCHSEGLDVSPGVWAALKMKRYVSSLIDLPQLSEKLIFRGYSRIFKALRAMHNLGMVHMDVKSDNLFVDDELGWNLGDFGSTRKIGHNVWSHTDVLTPFFLQSTATVIPAMDFVLLCVTIAVELDKDQWKKLCGGQYKVQAHRIKEKLGSIVDVDFKKEVVELFEDSLKTVEKHLQNH